MLDCISHGDPVVGSVYAFFSAFVSASTGAQKTKILLIVLFWFMCLLASGERINMLSRTALLFITIIFSQRMNSKTKLLILVSTSSIIGVVLGANGLIAQKLLNVFSYSYILSSGYFDLWMTGIFQWLNAPIFGMGADSFHFLWLTNLAEFVEKRCDNHPHNYWIQLLAETGAVGTAIYLLIALTLVFWIINKFYEDKTKAIFVIIPLLFSHSKHGDFFAQWFNLMKWFPLGL